MKSKHARPHNTWDFDDPKTLQDGTWTTSHDAMWNHWTKEKSSWIKIYS